MTAKTDTTDLTDLAEGIAEHEGWKVKVQGRWVEFAVATHGGHCPDDPTQTTGPAWDWIEDDRVKGAWGNGQCGGCGRLGRGWVHSDSERIDEHRAEDQLRDLADRFRARVDEAYAEVREDIRQRLTRDLRDALAALAPVADQLPANVAQWYRRDVDDEDLARLIEEHVTGTDMEPGVMREAGVWLAWDYDPTDGDDVITVTQADITSASA